jgi:hypothetical protein
MAERCRDCPIASTTAVGVVERHAGIGLGRMQGNGNVVAAMDPDARHRRTATQRRLSSPSNAGGQVVPAPDSSSHDHRTRVRRTSTNHGCYPDVTDDPQAPLEI